MNAVQIVFADRPLTFTSSFSLLVALPLEDLPKTSTNYAAQANPVFQKCQNAFEVAMLKVDLIGEALQAIATCDA